MNLLQSSVDVMDINALEKMSRRSRKGFCASGLVFILVCFGQPDTAFAQFDVGAFAGGVVGGLLARRGGGGYGYAPRYRHAYAGSGRHHERRYAQSRSAPRQERHHQDTSGPAVASAPPPGATVEHHNAMGPANGSLH